MRTVVIQSYRTENVPNWIRRCMDSVRAWTADQGFDYQFADDSSFALCGEAYLKSVGRNMRSITNLSRLELIRQAHGRGYDRAIWLDADVLVFHPALFSIDVTERYAFAGETWIQPGRKAGLTAIPAANNCAFVCMRGEPDLDFLIAATRHVAMYRRVHSNYQVGGDIVKGLRPSLDYATLDNIGMFSPHVMQALAVGEDRIVSAQAIEHRTPVFAANLCASEHFTPPIPEATAETVIDRLLATKGDVVNTWLLRSPDNLRDGKPHVGMDRLFPPRENAALQFRQTHGRQLDFDAPQTFNERIAAGKLLLTDPIYRDTADKYAVRRYVSERLGDDILIPLLQVCNTPEDLDLDALPDAFILKSAHASGWNRKVPNKGEVDADELRATMRQWLRTDFGSVDFEAQYRDIPPRVLVEPLLLTEAGNSPEDHRFYAFNGRVRLIGKNVSTPDGLHGSLFDPTWRLLNVAYKLPWAGPMPRPARLSEMIEAAETLAWGFEFARIDLYCFKDRILFGEITHTPNAGMGKFTPAEFDAVLGKIWQSGEAIPEQYFETAPKPASAMRMMPPSPVRNPRRPGPPGLPRGFGQAPASALNQRLMQFNALSNFTLDVTIATNSVPKQPARQMPIELGAAPASQSGIEISCLMVTRNRTQQAQLAVSCFRRQTWHTRELVIVDTSESDALKQWVESLGDPRIRFVFLPGCQDNLGKMRNLAVSHASGTHIAQWDDDDLSHPARLEAQVAVMQATKTEASLLRRELMWMPAQSRLAILRPRSHENTLICRKDVLPRYPELPIKEDTPAVQELIRTRPVSYLDQPEFYVYVVHGNNSCDDEHMKSTWESAPVQFVNQAYDQCLAQVARCYPVKEYRQFLAARTQGGHAGTTDASAGRAASPASLFAPPRA